MQFAWNALNHSLVGIRSLEDIIEIISAQLLALGHTAAWDRKNENKPDALFLNDKMVAKESGINVLVEGFTENHVAVIGKMYEAGARFLVLATEEPTDKGFNHGTQEEMVQRQKIFPQIAPFIEGIIHLVPGDHVTRWYNQFAPSAYTELGYAPRLIRDAPIVVKNPDGTRRIIPEPDYDFGFYGSLTPRREKLLKKLAKKMGKDNAVRLMVDFGTRENRDNEMRRAKVILQVRKFDEMGLVSSSRCNTAISIGRPVVAEPHDLATPWSDVIRFSKTQESFLDEALAVRSMWKGFHQQQLAKFKATFPPEKCIGAALAQLGIGQEAQRLAS